MAQMKKMGVSSRGCWVIALVLLVMMGVALWYSWPNLPLKSPVSISIVTVEPTNTPTLPAPPSPTLAPTKVEIKPTETPASPSPKPVTPTPTPNLEKAVSLGEALTQGWVSVEIRGPGLSSGDKFILTVGRPVTYEVPITIPTGSLLLNTIPTEPDMVVRRLHGALDAEGQLQPTGVIQMLNDEWRVYTLEAYSLNFHKGQVRPNAAFVWSDPPPSDTLQPVVMEVLQVLQAVDHMPEASPEAIQAAIWAITDGVSQEELKDKSYPLNVEGARAIFEATGLDPKHKRLFSPDQPKSAEAFFTRGQTYDQMQEYPQALADYSQAIELRKDYVEALYQRGFIFSQQQEFARAIADLSEVVRLDPKHREGYFTLGRAYFSKPDLDYEQAMSHLTRAIELDPNFAEAYYYRGLVYAAQQDFEQAIEDFNAAIKRDEQFVDAYYARGLAYAAQRDFEQAVKNFSEVIERDDEKTEAYYARGEAYNSNHQFAEAILDFNTVVKQRPEFAPAFRSRGMSYYYKKRYMAAIQDFKRYLQLSPQAVDGQEIAELIANLETISITPKPEAIPLIEVVEQELIHAKIFGLGTASGDSVVLAVQRTTDEELEITVPPGTVFISTNSNVQNMVVRRLRGLALSGAELQPAAVIHLTDNETQVYYIEAYGLNFHKTNPTTTTTFVIGEELVQPEVLLVLEAANQIFEGGGDIIAIQAAIWAITDDVTWLDLAQRQYLSDLRVVQTIFQVASLDLGCRKLFGGTPPCQPVVLATPESILEEEASPSIESTDDATSSDAVELPPQIPSEPAIETPVPPATLPPPPSVCPNPLAQITYPPMDAPVSSILEVQGTANTPNFKFYKVQYRPDNEAAWGQLYQSDQPVVEGKLMEWQTDTVYPGVWWLRLVVEDNTGNYPEPCEIRITVTQ